MNIDAREFAQWVGEGKLPQTLGVFNGADSVVAEATATARETLDRCFKHYSAVSKETRLSPGEKARQLKEAQDFINGAVSRSVASANARMQELADRATRERDRFVAGSISDELAMSLCLQIRQLGSTVITSDPRFMSAINKIPAAVSGLDDSQVRLHTDATIQRHNPALAQLEHSVAMSRDGVRRVEKVALHLAAEIDRNLDREALHREESFRSLLR